MKIVNLELWEVTSSGSKDIVFNTNLPGDVAVSELYINPLDTCTIVVKGYVSTEDTTGVTLKVVDIGNLEKKDGIYDAGNYMCIVGAYYKVNLTVTGTADINLKWLF